MIGIRKHNGKTESLVLCDNCEMGMAWRINISISKMEKIIRTNGWTAGKRHLCEKCKGDKRT